MIRAQRLERKEELKDLYGEQKQIEYGFLIKAGFTLPPISCSAVTREYLLGVKEATFARVKVQSQIRYTINRVT